MLADAKGKKLFTPFSFFLSGSNHLGQGEEGKEDMGWESSRALNVRSGPFCVSSSSFSFFDRRRRRKVSWESKMEIEGGGRREETAWLSPLPFALGLTKKMQKGKKTLPPYKGASKRRRRKNKNKLCSMTRGRVPAKGTIENICL